VVSSWLQIQRSRVWFRRYQVFWEVVGLERGPLRLVSTIEELFERKSSGSCPENWECGRRDQLCWPSNTLYPQKLTLTSSISGDRSVSIVRSWAKAKEFVSIYLKKIKLFTGLWGHLAVCVSVSSLPSLIGYGSVDTLPRQLIQMQQ
jgi:hypothetical protein